MAASISIMIIMIASCIHLPNNYNKELWWIAADKVDMKIHQTFNVPMYNYRYMYMTTTCTCIGRVEIGHFQHFGFFGNFIFDTWATSPSARRMIERPVSHAAACIMFARNRFRILVL